MTYLQKFYNDVLTNGERVCPRGMDAMSLRNTEFEFVPGNVYTRPGMNMDIGFIELLQWIAGTFSIKPFERYAPKAHLELFTYDMAYGPRTKTQWQAVIDVLNADHYTRRAVVMVAHHNDKPETLPCTLSLQFVLNRLSDSVQTLHTYVNMRSNDLVWGLPTDIIQFGGIAQMVASCTSSVATTVVVNCGDSHIYDATRLKEDQHFELAGEFSIPALYTLEAYKDWAAKALSLGRGVQKPRYACEYVPAEGTVETA